MNREWRFGVIPWENSLQIESGNKGERFGAAGDERGRGEPLSLDYGVRGAHALLAFFCARIQPLNSIQLRRFSRNLSHEITETEEPDRHGEEVSAPAARPSAHFVDSFQSLFLLFLSHPHSILNRGRCWRPHKHLIKATRLRDHHSCCASVALSFLPTR